ncbi:unnamed protein product, partial [Mesorhabditis spiculigera]
ETMIEYRDGIYGVVEADGDLWKEQRKFALHTLRDFGMGKNLMEQKVMTEVTHLLDRISNQSGIAAQWEFDVAVGSIINSLLFGYRYEEENLAEFKELKGLLGDHMKIVASPTGGLVLMLPWTRPLPYFKEAHAKILYIRDRILNCFRRQLADRKLPIETEFDTEQQKKKDEPDFGGFSMKQLENVIFDLWIAGMETTSNTLTWGLAFVLNDDEVQRKIHEELDSVLKSDRLVTLADKPNLNYINATICEIQRLANLLPMNLIHQTTEDVTINGHFLEAGTNVIPQISCVLFDEKIFPEPQSFKPERFLNPDGSLRKVEELIPFSLGKRQCLGEGLARMELFLFVANIFQKFKVTSPTRPSLKKSFGFTVQTAPYTCNFEERF